MIIHFLIAFKGDEVTSITYCFLFKIISRGNWELNSRINCVILTEYRRVSCILKVVRMCEWNKLINFFLLYLIGRSANGNSAAHIEIWNGTSRNKFIVIFEDTSNYSQLNASLKHVLEELVFVHLLSVWCWNHSWRF